MMEYYSAIKKNEILPFEATWMDLENIILSEISQTEKDKRKYYNVTYSWNLKNNTMNGCICKTEIDSQIQQTNLWLPKGRGNREGQIRGMGVTDTNYYISYR